MKVSSYTPYLISRQQLDDAFRRPLDADLDVLRVANSTFAFKNKRGHEKLPKQPRFSSARSRSLTASEFGEAVEEIALWVEKPNYDPYFCAGEMAAAFSEVLRCVVRRESVTKSSVLATILRDAIAFEERLIFDLIDDSSGDHEFTRAHIDVLRQICERRLEKGDTDSMLVTCLAELEPEE